MDKPIGSESCEAAPSGGLLFEKALYTAMASTMPCGTSITPWPPSAAPTRAAIVFFRLLTGSGHNILP
jgi:hypothetical protein